MVLFQFQVFIYHIFNYAGWDWKNSFNFFCSIENWNSFEIAPVKVWLRFATSRNHLIIHLHFRVPFAITFALLFRSMCEVFEMHSNWTRLKTNRRFASTIGWQNIPSNFEKVETYCVTLEMSFLLPFSPLAEVIECFVFLVFSFNNCLQMLPNIAIYSLNWRERFFIHCFKFQLILMQN